MVREEGHHHRSSAVPAGEAEVVHDPFDSTNEFPGARYEPAVGGAGSLMPIVFSLELNFMAYCNYY